MVAQFTPYAKDTLGSESHRTLNHTSLMKKKRKSVYLIVEGRVRLVRKKEKKKVHYAFLNETKKDERQG